jgi:FkbM family methyltransferase
LKFILKKIINKFPYFLRFEVKRIYYFLLIARNKFTSNEAEFKELCNFVSSGDWVLDIGANVGHYTCKLSGLVGPSGRVFAFEPVPETFAFLASNCTRFMYANATLFNFAASDKFAKISMKLPKNSNGEVNYYEASIVNGNGDLNIFSMPVDSIDFNHPVSFVKIDAEGHDFKALKGIRNLLVRDKPVLVIEENSPSVCNLLNEIGYNSYYFANSHNTVFIHNTKNKICKNTNLVPR